MALTNKKSLKNAEIVVNVLDDFEDNKYLVYTSNSNNKLELFCEDLNKDSVISLKNNLIKVHNHIVIKYGFNYENSKVIFEFKKKYNFIYELPDDIWLIVKEYVGLINEKFNFNNINNIKPNVLKLFKYLTFNNYDSHYLRECNKKYIKDYINVFESPNCILKAEKIMKIYNINPNIYNINNNTKRDVYELLSALNVDFDNINYLKQDIKIGHNVLIIPQSLMSNYVAGPKKINKIENHIYKLSKINKKSILAVKRTCDLEVSSKSMECITVKSRSHKVNLSDKPGYIYLENIFNIILKQQYNELSNSPPEKFSRCFVFSERNIPKAILNYFSNFNITRNYCQASSSLCKLIRRTTRISTIHVNENIISNNYTNNINTYNLIKKKTKEEYICKMNIFDYRYFYYDMIEKKSILDSKYNNTDNPIFTMTSSNKYMLKSIQNYVEDNENPNVIHII
tara:strand:- start:1944 stop:3305 length:1362 start_codon:yes stop_codon:yes gene_type:complete